MRPDSDGNGFCRSRLLPFGWEQAFDPRTLRVYYVDHNNKITTWLNPTDTQTKPHNVELCTGDQLPYGWERIKDPKVGIYYTDHISKRNQWTNPVSDWRKNRNSYLANNQHHYSNSQHLRLLEQSLNNANYMTSIIDSKLTPSSIILTKNDTSSDRNCGDASPGQNSDGICEKTATTSFGTNNTTRNYSTVNSKYDAGLLDIMDNCFGRGSSQSVEV